MSEPADPTAYHVAIGELVLELLDSLGPSGKLHIQRMHGAAWRAAIHDGDRIPVGWGDDAGKALLGLLVASKDAKGEESIGVVTVGFDIGTDNMMTLVAEVTNGGVRRIIQTGQRQMKEPINRSSIVGTVRDFCEMFRIRPDKVVSEWTSYWPGSDR